MRSSPRTGHVGSIPHQQSPSVNLSAPTVRSREFHKAELFVERRMRPRKPCHRGRLDHKDIPHVPLFLNMRPNPPIETRCLSQRIEVLNQDNIDVARDEALNAVEQRGRFLQTAGLPRALGRRVRPAPPGPQRWAGGSPKNWTSPVTFL